MKESSPADSSAAGSPLEIFPCRIRRRRHRRSRSRSLSTVAASSPSLCSSAVPFSWEHRPGIAKNPKAPPAARPARPALPRPPPLRSLPVTDCPAADPFAIALAECAKGPPPAEDDGADDRCRVAVAVRRKVAALVGWFALFDLYGSCKAAGSVAGATLRIPRPGSGRS
ncbi:uncharacterized protein LOC135627165 [Musa acuminata AAA Group]|uniref:uncharacterized protein LOC103971300 n=1 Tax=Musa acuminata AAA Group TaxID=214697 RepID=UPI0031D26C6C